MVISHEQPMKSAAPPDVPAGGAPTVGAPKGPVVEKRLKPTLIRRRAKAAEPEPAGSGSAGSGPAESGPVALPVPGSEVQTATSAVAGSGTMAASAARPGVAPLGRPGAPAGEAKKLQIPGRQSFMTAAEREAKEKEAARKALRKKKSHLSKES